MDILMRFIDLVPISLVQGLIYGFVALAVMIPFRLLDFPDLSCEGSFPLGGCICGAMLAHGVSPVTAMLAAVVGGFLAGVCVAAINRRFQVNSLLAGIIVVTMLYSVNLRILGRSNEALFEFPNIFDQVQKGLNESLTGKAIALAVLATLVLTGLYLFMRTEIGIALRAVGANAAMAQAQGINVGAITLAGIGAAAAFSALAGSIVVQSQGFADVNIGFGVVINALAALIIGELIVGRARIGRQLLAPLVGSVVYAQIVSLTLAFGLAPTDLKFASGVLVLLMLGLPRLLKARSAGFR